MDRIIIFLLLVFCVYGVNLQRPSKRKPLHQSTASSKIVGGQTTDIKAIPYQVSLRAYNSHICGGSIISSKHILTAAHCVTFSRNVNPRDLSVRVGSSYHNEGGRIYRVSKITVHPRYSSSTANYDMSILDLSTSIDPATGAMTDKHYTKWKRKHKTHSRRAEFDYDLAVLELRHSLDVSDGLIAEIITLARVEPRVGDVITVSGWGAVREDGPASRILKVTSLPVISRSSCQSSYKNYSSITQQMFCAGYSQGGTDACQGDSGGPAVNGGRQVGIVSWGVGCARPNAPGVYTNIANLRSWISSVAGI